MAIHRINNRGAAAKIAAALAGVLIVSCSSTTSPVQPTIAGAGSRVRYAVVNKDTVAGAPVESTRDTLEYEVSVTGLTVDRKANVSMFTPDPMGDQLEIALNYEPNQDASLLIPTRCGVTGWVPLLVSNRGTRTVRVCDSVVIGQTLVGDYMVAVFAVSEVTSKFVTDATYTLNGVNYSAMWFDVTLTERWFVQNEERSNRRTSSAMFNYSPQLGVLLQVEAEAGLNIIDQTYFDVSAKLIDINVKP